MHTTRIPEFQFQIGNTRAYVNPSLPAEVHHLNGTAQPAYVADGAIRINRTALFVRYDSVLNEVVRLSRLAPAYVDAVLQQVRQQITA